MQISSLIDIIDGSLLNSPSISFIYSFKTNPSKVKEGDLFIAKKICDIEEAVRNGAFAIITEQNHPIIDNEIAWIKVQSINLCIIQLIRFKLANFQLEAFYCNEISYDLLNVYGPSSLKTVRFIPKNLDSFIKILDDIEDGDVLISKDKYILDKLYPNNKNFNENKYNIENLIEHSLFEVSFSYNDFYFSKLKVPSLYIQEFIAVRNFFYEDLDLSKLKSFNHMKPIFIDKNWEVTEFGKSEKFVIIQNDLDLFKKEIDFLKNRYKYAKTIFITSKYITYLDDEQLEVQNISEIKSVLKKNTFNAAYIYGFNFSEVYEELVKLEKQDSLF